MSQDPHPESFAEASKEQTARTVDEFRDAAATKARQLRDAAGQQVDALRNQAADQSDQIRDSASGQWNSTRHRADELRAEMEQYVRENPTKSVLVVFGIGLFVGMLMRR